MISFTLLRARPSAAAAFAHMKITSACVQFVANNCVASKTAVAAIFAERQIARAGSFRAETLWPRFFKTPLDRAVSEGSAGYPSDISERVSLIPLLLSLS